MFEIILTDLLCNIQGASVTSDEDSEKCTSDRNFAAFLEIEASNETVFEFLITIL